MLNKYQNIIQKTNYIFFILLVCSLPFPTQFSLYAWGLWIFTWVLEGRFIHTENRYWSKGLIPIIALSILLFWELTSYFWAIHKTDASNMLIRHISYVAILPIAIYGVNNQYNWRTIAKWFVISCIASIIIYGLYLHIFQFWRYIYETHQIPSPVLKWEWFGYHISPLKHRLYYANILNLAIVTLLQIFPWKSSTHRYKKTSIAISIIALVMLAVGIAWTGSRANMLTLVLIGFVAIIQPLKGRTRIFVSIATGLAALFFIALIFTIHPRFDTLQVEHITERAKYQTEHIEPRINIWYAALQKPQDYIWHGVGVGGNTEYLKSIYNSFGWKYFYKRGYNTHNQYLGILINLGIFAAIFFSLIWLLYPLWYSGKTKHIATLFVVTIGSNMLTENILDRIDGVIVTCVFMLVISLLSRAQLSK